MWPELGGSAVLAGRSPLAGNADFDITECLSGGMEQGITARKHTDMGWLNLLWRSRGKGWKYKSLSRGALKLPEESQQEHNNMMVGAVGHKASVGRLPP